MIDQIGGRKLVAAGIVLAIALAIVLIKGDVPTNLLSLLQVVFGAFVIGNVGEHVTDVMQAHVEAKAAVPDSTAVVDSAAPDAVLAGIEQLHHEIQEVKNGIVTTQQGVSTILQLAGAGPR